MTLIQKFHELGEVSPALIFIKPELLALEQSAFDCDNGDILRRCEIDTARTLIHSGVDSILNGDWTTADELFIAAKKKIDWLRENPEHAGQHEHQREAFNRTL